MPKDKINTFYGAVMKYADVKTYYPVNLNYPKFDGFVFQQMIAVGAKSDDDFILIAYAVDEKGKVLNTVPLTQTTDKLDVGKKKIQFANMKLTLGGLGVLYPPSVTSALSIAPTEVYGTTNYIVYTCTTQDTKSPFLPHVQKIDPSPPA